jgi:hypothetical protein
MSVSTISYQPLFPSGAVTNASSSAQYCNKFTEHGSSQHASIQNSNEPCIPLTYTEKLIHFQHSPTTRQILLESVLSQAIENSNSLLSVAPACPKDDIKCVPSIDSTRKSKYQQSSYIATMHC